MELTPFNTLAKDHGRYFRRGATFFRVMAAIYLMSIFSVLSGHPISFDLIIPAPLIGVLFYTLARILDFLGDVAVMVDDMWLRVEDTRRGVRRQEERQS